MSNKCSILWISYRVTTTIHPHAVFSGGEVTTNWQISSHIRPGITTTSQHYSVALALLAAHPHRNSCSTKVHLNKRPVGVIWNYLWQSEWEKRYYYSATLSLSPFVNWIALTLAQMDGHSCHLDSRTQVDALARFYSINPRLNGSYQYLTTKYPFNRMQIRMRFSALATETCVILVGGHVVHIYHRKRGANNQR